MPPNTTNRLYTPLALRNQGFSRGMSGGDPIERIKNGLAYVETRGAPDAYTKKGVVVSKGMYAGDRALGKYQVMGKNVGPWTKQYLGRAYTPEEFLANPQIQEDLMTARAKDLYQKYGNEYDVASVHFTGQPLAKAGGTVADDNGTSNATYQELFKKGMELAGGAASSYQGATNALQGFGQALGGAIRKYTPLALRTAQGIPEAAGNLAMGAAQQTGKGLGMLWEGMDLEKRTPQISMGIPNEELQMTEKFDLPKIDPTGMVGSVNRVGTEVAQNAPKVFEGFTDLSTKLLEKLKGRTTVSRQFIEDMTNAPDLKQAEKDLIRRVLDESSEPIVPNTGYQMSHRPSFTGATADDISKNGAIPSDVYEHPEWYGNMRDETYQESFAALQKVRGNPDAEITIYRASPKNELNHGDWVTLSKKYAQGEAATEGTPVQSFKVKASDIQFAGDDINEFGYFPGGKDLPKKKLDTSYQGKPVEVLGQKGVSGDKWHIRFEDGTDAYVPKSEVTRNTEINVPDFANRVKSELLPPTINSERQQ